MSKSEKKSLTVGRRSFLGKFGLGAVAVAALSSCQKVSKLITNKEDNSNKAPTRQDVIKMLKASGEQEGYEKTLQSAKANIMKSYPSEEIVNMLSDESLKGVVEEQIGFLFDSYKDNFTKEEILFLTEYYESSARKKINDLKQPGGKLDSKEIPIRKFIVEVNTKHKEELRLKRKPNSNV